MTMTRELQQIHAIVEGRVQGVSYRYFSQQAAYQMGVKGWVRNLPNGTVEVLAQGTEAQLEQFLNFLRIGSPSAAVQGINVEWQACGDYCNLFQIRYHHA